MKTIILLLFTVSCFAQIKVVETTEKMEYVGHIGPKNMPWIILEKSDDTYHFEYRDVKYNTLDVVNTFYIKDIDNAIESLYNMMVQELESPSEDEIMLEIPEGYLWIDTTKSLGVANVRFGHSVQKTEVIGFTSWMTKKRLDKLFGKR